MEPRNQNHAFLKEYEDILNLPHHVSAVHPHMPRNDRAAQFLPFMALSGYEEKIQETARLTESRMELDDNAKTLLNHRLRLAHERLTDHPVLSIRYFEPDRQKSGGAYRTVTGAVKKIEACHGRIVMDDGAQIPIEEIVEMNGDFFEQYGLD